MKHAQPMRLSLRSIALLVLLSQASCSSVSSLHQHQVRDVRAKQVSAAEENNNEYVDMSSMGARISNLQMNMLNKKASDVQIELSPNDEQMLLINSNLNTNQMVRSNNKQRQRQRSRLRSRSRKEDLDDQDIMAYSAGDSSQSGEDGPSIFGSGGAISQALAENDPSLQEEEKPQPKKLSPGELLKIKQEKEAAEKLAKKKKKEAEEKRKKEEKKKQEEDKKKKEAQVKKDKEETEQLERQTHLLQNFLEDDTQTQKENESNYFYIKNPKKTLSGLANTNIKDQTEVETANDIIQKSRKTILTGMDGGLLS